VNIENGKKVVDLSRPSLDSTIHPIHLSPPRFRSTDQSL
jgi:hypothetical protein